MRAASSLLYGLKPYDPWTFMMAAVLLSVVTISASLIPATRAAHLDPIIALREQ
jgi:ABC-type lipoprotein release transport system permease subunit